MLKCVIWDFDGVICDSSELAFTVHNSICNKFTSIPCVYSKNDYAEIFDNKLSVSLYKYGVDAEDARSFFAEHRKLMLENSEKLQLFSDVVKIMEWITVPSIILTSSYKETVIQIMEHNEVSHVSIVDDIIGREAEGNKAEKLERICSERGYAKEEVIYIGDTKSDALYCLEVGVPMIIVGYGYYPYDMAERCDCNYFVRNTNDLYNTLRNFGVLDIGVDEN